MSPVGQDFVAQMLKKKIIIKKKRQECPSRFLCIIALDLLPIIESGFVTSVSPSTLLQKTAVSFLHLLPDSPFFPLLLFTVHQVTTMKNNPNVLLLY